MKTIVLENHIVLYVGTNILKDNYFVTENLIHIPNHNPLGAKKAIS
uniref:Uncharacterized protein n=1 Tax=Arundo donax TaxID=35708 RepID=A0A0A9GTW3_ARUDO